MQTPTLQPKRRPRPHRADRRRRGAAPAPAPDDGCPRAGRRDGARRRHRVRVAAGRASATATGSCTPHAWTPQNARNASRRRARRVGEPQAAGHEPAAHHRERGSGTIHPGGQDHRRAGQRRRARRARLDEVKDRLRAVTGPTRLERPAHRVPAGGRTDAVPADDGDRPRAVVHGRRGAPRGRRRRGAHRRRASVPRPLPPQRRARLADRARRHRRPVHDPPLRRRHGSRRT